MRPWPAVMTNPSAAARPGSSRSAGALGSSADARSGHTAEVTLVLRRKLRVAGSWPSRTSARRNSAAERSARARLAASSASTRRRTPTAQPPVSSRTRPAPDAESGFPWTAASVVTAGASNARSAAPTSATSPCARSRWSRTSGSTRVRRTRCRGSGYRRRSSTVAATSGRAAWWKSSSTRTTGSGSCSTAARTRRRSAGESRGGTASVSSGCPGGTAPAARSADRTSAQNAAGLSSNGSSVNQATRGPVAERAHRATAVVLPQPGPADTSVRRRVTAEATRVSTEGRATVVAGSSGTDVRAHSISEASAPRATAVRSARGLTEAMSAG
ncbi:hypothetical protein M768_15750 [Cellulosimicrobium cellulans F16]|uniref:Uncharacterized protein n=1 Tax=Cellulosimicrobium cellulans F16 TaxID=1350482 RepID=A0A0M0F4I8_CELCE|nr:hypothetical protein M768_15750 [Cellulosimicrobium cellulans F16]